MTKPWKILIISMLIYQIFLTWIAFDLIETAAYLARTECAVDWCGSTWMGYIRTNQGGYDTMNRWMIGTGLIVIVNAIVWIRYARVEAKPDEQATS